MSIVKVISKGFSVNKGGMRGEMVHFKIHSKSKVWGSKGPEPPNWMVL